MSAPARSVPVPASLATVAIRVERRLVDMFDHELDRWRQLDADIAAPLEALSNLVLAGGKRLRPAFCYWGYAAGNGEGADDIVIDAGAAFEVLQAFALVHDDVMDGSATRRGARAAHLEFAARHDDAGWRGEARRFGDGVAILIGDLAHVYADRFMAGVPADAKAVWDELRLELNVGQYLDVLGTARADTDARLARRIARYKSGKYTIERPLHIGATLAGRTDLLPALSRYGDPLGEAFQLRDDILGAFGDEAATGKPVGDDLREGKPTVLLAVAHQRASSQQLTTLRRVGSSDLDAATVVEIQTVLVDTGALEETERIIDELTDTAIMSLEDAPIADDASAALAELAAYVARRDH